MLAKFFLSGTARSFLVLPSSPAIDLNSATLYRLTLQCDIFQGPLAGSAISAFKNGVSKSVQVLVLV